MKFGLIFSALGATLIYAGVTAGCPFATALFFYASFSCLALGLAYLLNRPRVLLKRADGRFPALSWILYAPYHLHNHVFLEVFRRTSHKPRWTEIVPGLFLGGRLRPGDEAKLKSANLRSVLDVTAEFAEVKWLRGLPGYLCVPLLDVTAPGPAQLQQGLAFIRERLPSGPVYVHCAFGHSRSATFVIGYLAASGHSATVDDAMAFVQSKRPRVRLNAPQLQSLRQAFAPPANTPSLHHSITPPLRPSAPTEEIFDVVNDRDEVIGQNTRREVHRLGLKHRATHVLVFNKRGEIFLQKRSMTKDTHPGEWDSSASGHLDTGESYDACAVREVREEIGLVLKETPRRLFKLEACAATGQEFVWAYRCEAEGPFTLHPDEIERGGWFTPEEVTRWIAERPEEFAPTFPVIWRKWRAMI